MWVDHAWWNVGMVGTGDHVEGVFGCALGSVLGSVSG